MTEKQFRTFVHKTITEGTGLKYKSPKTFDNLRPWNKVFTTRLRPTGAVEVEFLRRDSVEPARRALQDAGLTVTGQGILFVSPH